jgi:hypothetical protein
MSAFELISDLYKDTYGVRPSASFLAAFDEQPAAEQANAWCRLYDEFEERETQGRKDEALALATYNARIDGMMSDYGIDQPTAIRWDMDSFEVDLSTAMSEHGNVDQEIEHYLWNQGVAFYDMPPLVTVIKSTLTSGVTE